MCTIELATNTATADTRMGSQSDVNDTMRAPPAIAEPVRFGIRDELSSQPTRRLAARERRAALRSGRGRRHETRATRTESFWFRAFVLSWLMYTSRLQSAR